MYSGTKKGVFSAKNPLTNNQIEEINELLNELKNEQVNLSEQTQKNFKVIMQKLMKIQEYNEISDIICHGKGGRKCII